MAKFLRKNAWERQGTFQNPDLFWYAKGVGVMQSKALNDPDSWWFFAAIHGENLSGSEFPGWKYIPGPPHVPAEPLPSQATQSKFWNQCQHQSWYFAPWHRGYLVALEAQIRSAILDLGGPEDWALPYWNYFGPGGQYKMPPAFGQRQLPDGTPNPLFVAARFGPNNNGVVYIDTNKVSQACQTNTVYTGSNWATPRPGYGGPVTSFNHDGDTSGNLEANPHNQVHRQVGGNKPNSNIYGLMGDADLAALDPIFYLHHCNIDRMWASWNEAGNRNPKDQNWLKGPAAIGERGFVMPMPNAKPWIYTPEEIDSLAKLNYRYDDTSVPPVINTLALRLRKFGIQSDKLLTETNMDQGGGLELVGANKGPVQIEDGAGIRTTVGLDSVWKKVSTNFLQASESNLPDRIYLQLENVTGNMDATTLAVSVNHQLADHISLFGLRNASRKDGHRGGAGLTFIIDITPIIDNLHLADTLDLGSLEVTILPDTPISEDNKITVGRVSIYREQYKI